MTRQELYQLIKEHNLEDKIKQFFNGKNYTNISTVNLDTFVSNHIRRKEKVLSGMSEHQSNAYCNRMICNAIKNFCEKNPGIDFGKVAYILDINRVRRQDNSQQVLWKINAALNKYKK